MGKSYVGNGCLNYSNERNLDRLFDVGESKWSESMTSRSLIKSSPVCEIIADMKAESLVCDWAVDRLEKIDRKRRRTRRWSGKDRGPGGRQRRAARGYGLRAGLG